VVDTEILSFIRKFEAAWASRDGAAFLALWHPSGVLHYPLVDRPISGAELGLLNDVQKASAPDLLWQLMDWTARSDIVMLEWRTTRVFGGKRFEWRGVDKLRLKEGKIIEEWVYMDTALLRALRAGGNLELLIDAAEKGIAFDPLFSL
jgi:hypothetical protein